jgi:uncharacterized protein YqhQ
MKENEMKFGVVYKYHNLFTNFVLFFSLFFSLVYSFVFKLTMFNLVPILFPQQFDLSQNSQ